MEYRSNEREDTTIQGQERVACPDCRGRGRRTFVCVACDGTGEERCHVCSGLGRKPAPWEADPAYCPDCRGAGYQRCEKCEGRGYVWEDCRTCDGEGYLLREEAEVLLGERLLAKRQQESGGVLSPSVWAREFPPDPVARTRGLGWLHALILRFLGGVGEPVSGDYHTI